MGLIGDALDAGTDALRRALERQPVERETTPYYVLGLDLGQTQDYSALTLDEIHGRGEPNSRHDIRYLHRWKLRTPYPEIVADVGRFVRRAPVTSDHTLVIDQTGVGRPVVDMFRAATLPINLVCMTITGGHQVTRDGDEWHVPKRDLVSVVAVLLQAGRLKIAASLREAVTLTSELGTFQTKITTAANDVYGAWRENTNDDTVLATAMACWYGENDGPAGVWFP